MRFKYRKYIYTATFSIMLLGMMIFSTKNSFGTGKEEKKEGVQKTAEAASEAAIVSDGKTDLPTGSAISSGKLLKDAYPEINQLIIDFFNAKLKVDKDEIAKYVDNVNYVGMDRLPDIVEEIEYVDGVVCYTLDGPEKDSYIVYAYNEVKFKDVSTKTTALDGFYVRKDENGTYKIVLSPLSKEIQDIVEADSKREDVAALIADVNTKLKTEIRNDKKLAELLKKIREKVQKKTERPVTEENGGDTKSVEKEKESEKSSVEIKENEEGKKKNKKKKDKNKSTKGKKHKKSKAKSQ